MNLAKRKDETVLHGKEKAMKARGNRKETCLQENSEKKKAAHRFVGRGGCFPSP